jgi:hypothetical protein
MSDDKSENSSVYGDLSADSPRQLVIDGQFTFSCECRAADEGGDIASCELSPMGVVAQIGANVEKSGSSAVTPPTLHTHDHAHIAAVSHVDSGSGRGKHTSAASPSDRVANGQLRPRAGAWTHEHGLHTGAADGIRDDDAVAVAGVQLAPQLREHRLPRCTREAVGAHTAASSDGSSRLRERFT